MLSAPLLAAQALCGKQQGRWMGLLPPTALPLPLMTSVKGITQPLSPVLLWL